MFLAKNQKNSNKILYPVTAFKSMTKTHFPFAFYPKFPRSFKIPSALKVAFPDPKNSSDYCE